MAITQAQVAQLYVALFNRAPEGAGLRAWVAAGASKTQAQLADDMLRSPAVQSYFNGSIDTNRGYVQKYPWQRLLPRSKRYRRVGAPFRGRTLKRRDAG